MVRTTYTIDNNLLEVKEYLKYKGVIIHRIGTRKKGGYILECSTPKEHLIEVAKVIHNLNKFEPKTYLFVSFVLILISFILFVYFVNR